MTNATRRPEVEIRRSTRRRRTSSARREGDRIIVMVPARMSAAQEQQVVDDLVRRVLAAERRRTQGPSEAELMRRARALSRQHLGGLARPVSVRWVDNQNTRWGSCTPARGTIRLSSRLIGMPEYVQDYVLLHELAHLLQPHHGPSFWALLGGYRRASEADAFLAGVNFGSGLPATVDDPEQDADDEPVSAPGAPA
ncbi:M48 family metallopeptidase [Calidifontibacter sp. DB0510]|uniref:M48 family metallopeptidase n=1 Tax=Metallococcus carri TaxID=1656884 RepID=A0A967EB13_9MICO|nr:M48 family metallopeptidase [Metallococcus carri]NHN56479.1 M48 family metallopeptidase [Metallococcus carri]NOP36103.1 M48 family metallopeptidase [Calidifontibacter sp. DB2511S]